MQPLVADTGKIFYMESTCNHALQIRSNTVTVDTEGGDAIVWRDVLEMLGSVDSSGTLSSVVGASIYSAPETLPGACCEMF